MAETQETTADIIAEKRRRADEIERDCAEKMRRGEMTSDQYARELVADIRREADRLGAAAKRREWTHMKELETKDAVIQTEVAAREAEREAHKREIDELKKQVGNAAKLREAVEFIKQYFDKIDPFNINTYTFSQIEVEHINEAIDAALAAPPRNCDKFSHDEALQVWASEKGNERNGCFDEWLYEIAKDGGAK